MEFISIIILLGLFAFACWGIYNKITSDKKQREDFEMAVQSSNQEKENAISKNIEEMSYNYNKAKGQLSIPEHCQKIDVETTVFGLPCKATATAGKVTLLQNDFYAWVDNDTLYIFPTEEHLTEKHIVYRTLPKDLERLLKSDDIPLYKIDKGCIDYYKIVGSERAETQIQTANTGVNVKGAIVGGIIAGEAGAIIGSQHNTNNMYSTTQHFDERYVELFYHETGKIQKIKLSITAYPILEKCFPDKEYFFTLSNNTQQGTNAFDEIKKYKELLDTGIISQNEFEQKKRELLNL